jgi:hemoglobin-like flavoprotein
MTPAQKQLVQASFARLAPSADAAAAMFYRELFALNPDLRKLFRSDLAEQGQKLISMLGTAIVNLDRLENIVPAVRDLGRRHAGYGVEPADYETVACALIATLEQGLGSDFTPALREAWASCYRLLAGEMMAGASERRSGIAPPEPARQPGIEGRDDRRLKLLNCRALHHHANEGENHVTVVHQIHTGHRGR